MSNAANWNAFQIQLPGQDLLEPAQAALETVVVFLEVVKTVLDVVKAFLLDIPNPVAALVQALEALVQDLIKALNQTGGYAYFDIPNPAKDPNLRKYVGGFQAFTQRFKGSLLNTRDPSRPQPVAGLDQSGFVLLVADAESIAELIRLVRILTKFFKNLPDATRFPAPANVKVLPMGSNNEPLSSLASVFSSKVSGASLQWTLAGSTNTSDPGFNDLGSVIASEFVPPKWLIERSSSPINKPIDVAADGVGPVTAMVQTNHEAQGVPGQFMTQKIRLHDENGEPVVKFDTYKVLTVTDDNGNVLNSIVNGAVGELGFMQYFDTDVQPDTTYYYRIRAYTGTLSFKSDNKSLNWATTPVLNPTTKRWYLPWPGTGLTMGKASGVFRMRIPPKLPANFDVQANLKQLFLAAFALNFHLPLPSGSKFDSNGNPIAPTPVTTIGMGTLTNKAGVLSSLISTPLISSAVSSSNYLSLAVAAQPPVDSITNQIQEQFWQKTVVKYQANRLAAIVASAFLEQGSTSIEAFRKMMQGALPKGPIASQGLKLAAAQSVSDLVFAIAAPGDATSGAITADDYTAYVQAFNDATCRKNVLAAVQSVLSYSMTATPPDWISVSILRDIIPWSSQLIYEILAKIQAMAAAFKGIAAEIAQFVDVIERKITVLEQFLEYLIQILDYILALEGGFYLLSVPNTGGDVNTWFSLIDSAGGTPPPSGPGGYSAGIAFAYVGFAPDVAAFAAAFATIF